MHDNNQLRGQKPIDGRSFTDVAEWLLPLFSALHGRDSRRWREVFGLERPAPVKKNYPPFKICVRRSPTDH
jgi:hypothetical protein